MKRALALVGLMGSGKTQVGRELAKLLGLRWVDLDAELVKRHGPIARQFQREGEAAFRRRESAELKRQLRSGVLLSTGGGVVLDAGNRALLKRHLTVYLQAPLRVLLKRLRGAEQGKRPLLQGATPALALARLQRQRRAFYRQSACFSVRAGHGTPLQVAARIAKRLKGFSLS